MPDNRDNERSARTLLEQGVRLVIVKRRSEWVMGICKGQKPAEQCGVIPTRGFETFGSGMLTPPA